MHWPKGQKVKGQGLTVTKTVTVARLLVTRAATGPCWRRCACRFDCLYFLVFIIFSTDFLTPADVSCRSMVLNGVCLSVCLSFRMISQKPMQLGSSNLTQMQKCSRTRHWKLQHRRIILFPRVILNFTLDAVSKIWRLINRVRVQYLNEIFRCYQ